MQKRLFKKCQNTECRIIFPLPNALSSLAAYSTALQTLKFNRVIGRNGTNLKRCIKLVSNSTIKLMKWQDEHEISLSNKNSDPKKVKASVKHYIAQSEPSNKSTSRPGFTFSDRRRNRNRTRLGGYAIRSWIAYSKDRIAPAPRGPGATG